MEKKLTVADILAKKGLIEANATPFKSDFFDAEIEVENVHGEKIPFIMAGDNDEMYKYYELIYTACPVFRAGEIAEEFGCDDPFLAVKKAYGANIAEIIELGNYILSIYGYNSGKISKLKKQ